MTTLEEFITKATATHGSFYDYSTINLDGVTNVSSKVKIICKKHGSFEQSISNHLGGAGCTPCGIDSSNKKKMEKFSQEFIKKAVEIFGDLYDYSKVVYVSTNQYVIITCKKHGDFRMKPNAHIGNKSHCPTCAIITRGEKKSTSHDEFINKCRDSWGDKFDNFDYSKTNYKINRDKLIIRCIEHNQEFIQLASAHLRGQYGCSQCSEIAKEQKRIERMNEVFEPLWSMFKNDVEIHVHKKTCFINATALASSIKKTIPAWTNKHKDKIQTIKEQLKYEDDLVQQISVGSLISLIHPYLAIVYARSKTIENEILPWLNDVSKTCPMMRNYLEEACEIDEKLKTELTELKFFEEEKIDYVIDTSKYKLILNDIMITARPEDGFINATQLCKAGNKKFNDWYRLESTKKLIEALEKDSKSVAGIVATKLLEIKQGGDAKLQGSWIHQDLAIHLAMWISADFAIQVSKWTREIIYTGKVDIQHQKTETDLLKLQNAYSKQLIENKKLQKKVVKRVAREKFSPGNHMYAAQTDTVNLTRRIKIGKTTNLEETLAAYNRLEPTEYIFYMDCCSEHMMDVTETFVHSALAKYRDYANHEYFLIPEGEDAKFFIDIIRNIINAANNSTETGIMCETTFS
jgi:KilA-N domain/T5orf172 domain